MPQNLNNASLSISNPPAHRVVKGAIQTKFGGYRAFVPHSGGMTELQVSQILTGRRILKSEEAQAWAEALDLSAQYLMLHFGTRN